MITQKNKDYNEKGEAMRPLVYQIVLGKTSKWLDECICSVKNFADRNMYDYYVDVELPEKYQHMQFREASEWMRLEKLASRPYVLYVDWDIKILRDFVLKDEMIIIKVIDAMLYFGKNVDIAKKVFEKTLEKYSGNYIPGMGHFSFIDVIGEDYQKYWLSDDHYKHLMWNTTGSTFYI